MLRPWGPGICRPAVNTAGVVAVLTEPPVGSGEVGHGETHVNQRPRRMKVFESCFWGHREELWGL